MTCTDPCTGALRSTRLLRQLFDLYGYVLFHAQTDLYGDLYGLYALTPVYARPLLSGACGCRGC